MPQAANLVLKNGAQTPVDKTFILLAPAAGYGSTAEWALKEGPISSVFPRLTALVRPGNGPATRAGSKVTQLRLKVPSSYTDTVTGLTNVLSAFEANITVTVPSDYPESLKDDAIAFLANSLASALVKSMIKDGAPAS